MVISICENNVQQHVFPSEIHLPISFIVFKATLQTPILTSTTRDSQAGRLYNELNGRTRYPPYKVSDYYRVPSRVNASRDFKQTKTVTD